MILRKPYAFLIKHFRIIHIFIAILLAIIAVQTRNIYTYINSVISSTFNRYEALNYINFGIYIYILLALILCYVIRWLLKYKDKPRNIYIIIIAYYIIVAIFIYILFTYMRTFTNSVPDAKSIRLYRDILMIMLVLQYYFTLVMLIRGFGFDIKKFNFASDVAELNATASDSEEIEINTRIDTTNLVRGLNKQKREWGYFFQEFKLYIIIILIALLSFGGYKFYNYFNNKYKVYKETELVGYNNWVAIDNSYYHEDGNHAYVIIDFAVAKGGQKELFNTGSMALYIDNVKYLPDKNICYKFSHLGTCYKKQYITDEYKNYLLTYYVDNLNIQKAHIIYADSYGKTYKIKLVMKEA